MLVGVLALAACGEGRVSGDPKKPAPPEVVSAAAESPLGAPSVLDTVVVRAEALSEGAAWTPDEAAAEGQSVELPGTLSTATFNLPSTLAPGRYSVHVRLRETNYASDLDHEQFPRVAFLHEGTTVSWASVQTEGFIYMDVGGLDVAPGQTVAVQFLNDLYGGAANKDRNVWVDTLMLVRDPRVELLRPEAGDLVSRTLSPGPEATLANALIPQQVLFALMNAEGQTVTSHLEYAAPYCFTGDGGRKTCNPWDTRTVPDGTYTLNVTATFANGMERSASRGFVVSNAKPAVYAGPLVVTRGGTYSGNFQSLDAQVPVVSIRTTEPVILASSNLRGRGTIISGGFTDGAPIGVDLTVRNVRAYGLNPNVAFKQKGRFITVEEIENLRVENNHVDGCTGIYVRNMRSGGPQTAGHTIQILRNRVRNVDGRVSDGNDGFIDRDAAWQNFPSPHYPGITLVQFAMFNNVKDVANLEIAWNEVTNVPEQSRVEDNINMYSTRATAASPMRIHDNVIHGAYPLHPGVNLYSGGGILMGDGGEDTLAKAGGYIQAFDNQIVNTTNYGIGILTGHDSAFFDNRVLFTGYLPDGRKLGEGLLPVRPNTGTMIWDYAHGLWDANGMRVAVPTFFNNAGHDNLVSWGAWHPHCGQDSNGVTHPELCGNNGEFPSDVKSSSTVAQAGVAAELSRWDAKRSAARVAIGVP